MDDQQLMQQVKNSDVVELLQQLIRIKSVNPPGDELEIARVVAAYLEKAGLDVEMIHHSGTRASVYARLKGTGELPAVFFSGHLDTVPVGLEQWEHDPFSGALVDGKVWGRGSVDMKGGLAAQMVTARLLAENHVPLRGDLVLGLTAGEEADSLGATALAKRGGLPPTQVLLVGEPSNNTVLIAEKGALWLELTTHGRTSHGSVPERGRNAVMMMIALLTEFDRMPVVFSPHWMLGGFTRSINTFNGGVKTNVVPDNCVATIDMRTVPGQVHAQIVEQVEEIIRRLEGEIPDFRADIRVVNDRAPVTTSEDDPAVQKFMDVVEAVTGKRDKPGFLPGYTDGATLGPALQAPMIICGPGIPHLSHMTNEYNEVAQLHQAVEIYTAAVLKYLR